MAAPKPSSQKKHAKKVAKKLAKKVAKKLPENLHKVLSINFNRAQDGGAQKRTRQIYKKQCKKLISKENQDSLIKVLTIGRLERIPFLLLLVDCYTRDRFDAFLRMASTKQNSNNDDNINDIDPDDFINDHTILTVSTWTKQFIQTVSATNKSIIPMAQDIEASINACFKRYAGKFFFNQSVKIKDDRLRFANYALAGAYFVDRLVDRERAIPPFQIDFMILPRETKCVLRNRSQNGNATGICTHNDHANDHKNDDPNPSQASKPSMALLQNSWTEPAKLTLTPIASIADSEDNKKIVMTMMMSIQIHLFLPLEVCQSMDRDQILFIIKKRITVYTKFMRR